jgi:hypothetical protein
LATVREDDDFEAIVSTVIHRDRVGHRLLIAYYVLAAVVIIVTGAVQPAEAGIVIGVGFGIGVILLVDVSLADRRALRPLQANWPQLATVPAPGGQERHRAQARSSKPHQSLAIVYVMALFVAAAAGGLAATLADGSAVSAAIVFGIVIIIVGPICGLICYFYQANTRRPYLSALERALADGPGVVASGQDPAQVRAAAIAARTHGRHYRAGEYIWGGVIVFLLLARVGTLVALVVVAAFGGGTVTAGSAAAPAAYPTPAVAHGVVTDSTAGITYSAPPGSGWSEDTGFGYPTQGAEFIENAPGGSDDFGQIVSAPLPAGIGFQGKNGLQDAAGSYAANLVGTYNSPQANTPVLADKALTVCGRPAWLVEFRIDNSGAPDDTAALIVVSLDGTRRPGTLYVSMPATMDTALSDQLVRSVRPIGGC